MKNKKNIHNFGATSEFAREILTRVATKLNPPSNKGSVSGQSRQYLSSFSTWETSQGVSDDLKQYMGPLEVNHQSTYPDASGLEKTNFNNAIFDEAMKNVIMEMYQESNQTNFAKDGSNDLLKTFFITEDGKLNPLSTGIASAGAAAIYTALTRKKKKDKEKDDEFFDIAKSAGLGYLAGHGGAMIYNGAGDSVKSNKPKIASQPKTEKSGEETPTSDATTAKTGASEASKTKGKEDGNKAKSSPTGVSFKGYHLTEDEDPHRGLKVSLKFLKKHNLEKAESVMASLRANNPGLSDNYIIENLKTTGIRVPASMLPEGMAFESFDRNDGNLYVRGISDPNSVHIIPNDEINKSLEVMSSATPSDIEALISDYDGLVSRTSELDRRTRFYVAHKNAIEREYKALVDPDYTRFEDRSVTRVFNDFPRKQVLLNMIAAIKAKKQSNKK